MKKRIYIVLLLVGFPIIILFIPVWGFIYILTGRFFLADYMEYLMNKVLDQE